MESGEITDCQLKSSPVSTRDHNVTMIRPGIPSFWSPAVDLDVSDHWIQISFHRLTQIGRIKFHAIPDQGVMLTSWIETSRNGIDWSPVVSGKKRGQATSQGSRSSFNSDVHHKTPTSTASKSATTMTTATGSKVGSASSTTATAGARVPAGSLFDLVYQEDGTFEHNFNNSLQAQFLRIHGTAFSRSGFRVGVSLYRDERNQGAHVKQGKEGEDDGRRLIGLKMELYGCYMEPSLTVKGKESACLDDDDTRNEGGSGGGVRGGRDSAVREYSVNSKSNIILLCEVQYDYRWGNGNLITSILNGEKEAIPLLTRQTVTDSFFPR